MNFFNDVHHPCLPDFQFLRPSAVRQLPHSVETGSRWETYGSSSGWSAVIAESAQGEHFERQHFYLDICSRSSNTLQSSLTPTESAEFTEAFSQTSNNLPSALIANHNFRLSDVIRVSDFTRCKIPTVCLSISAANDFDDAIYPRKDTCGCCTHTTMEKSIHGALKEALERQFLIKFWLTLECQEKIETAQALDLMQGEPSHHLLESLSRCGELVIIDVTDQSFPGTCILICYGNTTNDPLAVKYCAGMSYSDNRISALEKATLELWQTYRFMHMFSHSGQRPDELRDPYIKHFISINSYETYKTVSLCAQRPENHKPNQVLTTSLMLQALRTTHINGYLYCTTLPTKAKNLYACKFISPNLFMHMNNASNINIKNRYSERFANLIKPEQQSIMVPFP